MELILASKSPRRQQLLQQLAIDFRTLDIDIDESQQAHETPSDYVTRMASEKARAGKEQSGVDATVIGADTIVVVDGEVLGKALQPEHALAMLAKLSGRQHQVMTAVTVQRQQAYQDISVSRVCFRHLTADEISAYSQLDEPLGKAGGYAIQGMAAQFIAYIEGSYSGIMGLPLFETARLIEKVL